MSWISEPFTDNEVRVLRAALAQYATLMVNKFSPHDQSIARDLDERLMRAKRSTAVPC